MIVSDSYMAGYTLRFPRIVRLRPDKDWQDSTTLEELVSMAGQAHRRGRQVPR